MNYKNYLGALISILIATSLCGQEKFSADLLSNYKENGAKVAQMFKVSETTNFQLDSANTIILENGLRSSFYLSPEAWTGINEDVEPVSVSVVFSKYPIRRNGYSMNHKLLFNRLKNLFEIDPFLNDSELEWNIVLHTNCTNDEQVDSLFHGVLIKYKTDEEATALETEFIKPDSIKSKNLVESVERFNTLPAEVREKLENKNQAQKAEILIDYFTENLEDTTSTEITPEFLVQQENNLDNFITTYGSFNDDTVLEVLNRNTEWKNALVVADWTGSMYQFGAQALLWHTLNIDSSGLNYFTLFNDGDSKPTPEKFIGETEGIYFQKADNIDKIIDLYQLVMLKGGGGDAPENDIEAILKGIEQFPNHSEIILIADNNACIRDIELVNDIQKPVRIIICGYTKNRGLNPQYVEIAEATGGSIHTIDEDIYNLAYNSNRNGSKILKKHDVKIGRSHCYSNKSLYPDSYYESEVFTNLDSIKRDKKRIANLDLSSQSFNKIPGKIRGFRTLKTLDLSSNNISKISKPIYNLYALELLDLSHNNLSSLPNKQCNIQKLKRLDLSHNELDSISPFPRFRYLTHLNLSYNAISNLPRNINLSSVTHLYLDYNELTALPYAFSKMKKLKELTLSGNSISILSKGLGNLKKLEMLDLSDNELTELPSKITRLKKLKTLVLTGNEFTLDYIAYLRTLLPETEIIFQ